MQRLRIKNQNRNLKFRNNFFKHFGFWLVILIFELWILNVSCFAKDISFETSVDRNKVSLGRAIQLSLTFYGTQNITAPELPDIDGFEFRYLGPSTMMSIVNGKVSSSITHMYTLIPLKVGTFQIGPLSFEYKGDTYTSKAITIEAIEGPVSESRQTPMSDTGESELKDKIFSVMEVEKRKAYINEIVPVTIKLYVNRLSIRDIQYPQFAHEGFSVGEFDKPNQYQEEVGGIVYDVIEFETGIFGTRPGEFTLGPAQLQCNLIARKEKQKRPSSFFDDFFGEDIFGDFFGRYETYPLNLTSIEIPITVMPFLEEGKPKDFNGALGSFGFVLDAEPREVKVGDPITLRMTIKGKGNFNTITCPKLHSEEGFKIYEPQVKQEEGAKIFEQILMPKDDVQKEIPTVSFSFFDPEKQTYQTITKGPLPIKVTKPEKEEELKIVEIPQAITAPLKKETLGRDIIYIKDTPGELKRKGEFLYKNKLFIIIQSIPLLVVIFVLIFQRRRKRLQTDIRYARRLRAPRKAKKNLGEVRRLLDSKEPHKFFDAVFETLQEYLGDKFHLPTAGITSDVVEELKSHTIIDNEILNRLRECFSGCDVARYAPSGITKEEMLKTLTLLEEIIDMLERIKV